MKKIPLFTFLLFIINQAYSQDLITTTSDKEIKAKVVEVNSESVKYKKFDNPDGPTYTVNLSEIKKIKYTNGDEDVFEPKSTAKTSSSNDGNSFNEGKDTPAIFKGKFDIENVETHDYLELITKIASEKILQNCSSSVDNSTSEIFWDQTFRDDLEGTVNITIIVKWDKGVTNTERWIKGIIKINKKGEKTWSFLNASGGMSSVCGRSIKNL